MGVEAAGVPSMVATTKGAPMAEKKRTDADADGFSAAEKKAMKERAAELRAAKKGEAAEADVLAKIAEMSDADRAIAEGLHALVKDVVPEFACKTWYGFPAYLKGKDIVVFYQPSAKFGTRYSTLGFNDSAALDDGAMWPTAYALTAWNASVEKQVRALLVRAFGA